VGHIRLTPRCIGKGPLTPQYGRHDIINVHVDVAQVIPKSQHAIACLIHLLRELILLELKGQDLLGEGIVDTEYALVEGGHGPDHVCHLLDIVR
jgi:hypothetical protein